jgi:hypothetical protein
MVKGAGTPVPAKATACGALEALSLTVSVPVRVPVAVGVNLMPMVQLAPAAKELEQVPCPAEEKSSVIDAVPKVSVPAPVLVKVTNSAELDVPTV